jgi:hypothetical protein
VLLASIFPPFVEKEALETTDIFGKRSLKDEGLMFSAMAMVQRLQF